MAPPPPSTPAALLFYDGQCGLCHRLVRFLVERDHRGALQYAPLHGKTFHARIDEAHRRELPDSLVLLTTDGRLLLRSDGALRALALLGGGWRALAAVAGVFPRFVRDPVYALVAAIRNRVFALPNEACPLIPTALRPRFLP